MYKRYNKKHDYSYTLGAYPTIELMNHKPDCVIEVVTHSSFSQPENEGNHLIHKLAAQNNIPLRCCDRLIEKLAPKENCYVIGFFSKYAQSLEHNNHLVLVNPSNYGNLGTIIRTMLAFECYDLATIEPSVDPFNPETIRASMGAVFRVSFELFKDFNSYRKKFPQYHSYMMMTDGKTTLTDAHIEYPYSIVFGNESSGLPEIFKKNGNTISIKQSKDVDSLNLAVSVGIVLHHLS